MKTSQIKFFLQIKVLIALIKLYILTSKQTLHKSYLKRRKEEKQEFLFCFYYRLSIREELCYASTIGNNTITGSTDLLEASYRKFHWKLIIGAGPAHSDSAYSKPTESKFTWCDFTNFPKPISANLHLFPFQEDEFYTQNLSNCCRHTYGLSISRF